LLCCVGVPEQFTSCSCKAQALHGTLSPELAAPSMHCPILSTGWQQEGGWVRC
jgi:hypothetical protein